jgi:ATP-binding cassette, subfamily B, bacterial
MPKEQPKSVFNHYKSALGTKYLWLCVLEAVLFSVSIYGGAVLLPIYYQKLIDVIILDRQYSEVLGVFYSIITISVIVTVFDRLFEYLDAKLISKGMVKVADYSMNILTRHSYQFFTNNFAGSLVTKLKRFVNSFDALLGFIIREFLLAIVSVIGIIYTLFQNSSVLAFTALTWFVIFFYTVLVLTRIRIPLEKKKSESESKVTGVLSDIISNVLNLKLFSSQNSERKNFHNILILDEKARDKAWSYANNSYTLQQIITLLAKSSLMFVGILLWSYGQVSPGTIVLVITYGITLFNRLGGLGSAIRRFSDSYTNANEFVEIINQQMEIKDPAVPEVIRIKEGEIVFDNVTFSYKQGSKILDAFNFKIKAGERVGVVGTSGAGKTTLTKLLLRFADVTSGAILIDGQDIRNITQDDLRSAVSYVPQDPILFHRNLAENIAYGRPDATMDEIITAAKQAHAHEFIQSLSHGYDTLVGERGVKLSGGERQRVAIARAILKNAPILILDEATSALDSVSETYIKEALNVLMSGKTTIVIAHRLSTVEKMDRIIVMEKGVIVEEGTHDELSRKNGIYKNFWNHQHGGFIR